MLEQLKRNATSGHAKLIKDWIREFITLAEEYAVLVTELKCTEPGCPPLETVIALLGPNGQKYQRKIHLPVASVTEAEVQTICIALKKEMNGQSTETVDKMEDCDEHH